MAIESIRVSLRFAAGSDHGVESTAGKVLANLFGVPEFSDPPVIQDDLAVADEAFTASLAAMANGGKQATAHKNACRVVLVGMLKNLALFVQIRSAGSLSLLLSSGFDAASNNRTRVPQPKPIVIRIAGGMSGQTILAVTSNTNARSWQSQYALIGEDGVPGEWTDGDPSTSSRAIVIGGLIPGRLYALRVRSVGGSNGTSDWSDPITHRAN
jgi:hypothetical protein